MELIPLSDIKLKIEEMYDDPEKGYNYARLSIGPLNEGYGTTIGNMLRRVLLSSIEGAAPIAYKLSGFYHEFTSLPGIYEDGLQITVNLKKLVVKLVDSDFKTLYISKVGPAVVRASDISKSADVEIVNDDLRLFEITDNIEVKMEIVVAKGRGYMTEEEVKEKFGDITPGSSDYITIDASSTEIRAGRDVIFIDAFFSPVKRVAFKVNPARVGKSSKYDQLILEIWTNRSVTAIDALMEAVAIIRDRLAIFDNIEKAIEEYYNTLGGEVEKEYVAIKTSTPLSALKLPDLVVDILQRHGIDTVEQLVDHVRSGEIDNIPHIGAKRKESIIKALSAWLADKGEELFLKEEKQHIISVAPDKLDEDISNLGLGSLVEKNLREAGIQTIGQLVDLINKDELISIKGIGKRRAEKIKKTVIDYISGEKRVEGAVTENVEKEEKVDILEASIEVLGLDNVTKKILESKNITTIAQLKELVESGDLARIRGIGSGRQKKIEQALATYLEKGGQ